MKSAESIRETLKRCPEETIEAAIAFQENRDPKHVAPIAMGIVERFLDPETRPQLRSATDETKIVEDLGIDSMLMVEIVIMVEEVLDIRIENDEVRDLQTLGDVKSYLERKVRGDEPETTPSPSLGREKLASLLPYGIDFLFLDEAQVEAERATGTYRFRGSEPFAEEHFPGNPVFPASLMIEALGQLAVTWLIQHGHASDSNPPLFVSCESVRCKRICKPGDTLALEVNLKRLREPLASFDGNIQVGEERAVTVESCTLTLGSEPSEEPEA